MRRPSTYPRELRERAVRIDAELRPDYPSEYAAMIATSADARHRFAGEDPDVDPPGVDRGAEDTAAVGQSPYSMAWQLADRAPLPPFRGKKPDAPSRGTSTTPTR